MDFKIGDIVFAEETIRKHWELVMRKNQKGKVVKHKKIYGYVSGNKSSDGLVIELNNGETVEVPKGWVKHYKKKEKLSNEGLDNKSLVERYEKLIIEEVYKTNTQTKAYEKLVKDIERDKLEIIKRMGG